MPHAPLEIISEPADDKGMRPTEIKVDRAIDAFQRQDPTSALRLATAVAKQTRMGALDAARLSNLLAALGEGEAAQAMFDRTLTGIAAAAPETSEDFELVFDCGHTLAELNQADAATPVLRRALQLRPDDARAAMPLLTFLLQADKPDEAMAVWRPVLKACHGKSIGKDQTSDALWSSVIRALSYFGYHDHAEQMLQEARAAWVGDKADYDKLTVRARGTDQEEAPLADVIREFDTFAEIYDENLQAIGNRGPRIVAGMVDGMDWPRDASREILDAGCGTGLCAPYLRPYAKMLHGCDLSIQMLEKSKKREIYDLLTRTDLSNLVTYPEGSFDVIVAADVFVYFGELGPVLKNLAARLKPGGWLFFTVEDATRYTPARGWEKHPSGRFRHMPDYVRKSLSGAGFGKPKIFANEALRLEFGVPVPCLAVGTQKLSLLFGAT